MSEVYISELGDSQVIGWANRGGLKASADGEVGLWNEAENALGALSSAQLRTGTTSGNSLQLQARDVDGASWTSFVTLTAGNTPTCAIDGTVIGATTPAAATFTAINGKTPSAFGLSLWDAADAAAARNTLGASSGRWPVSLGGTGAATAADARTALGVNTYYMSLSQTAGSAINDGETRYLTEAILTTAEGYATRLYPMRAGTITRVLIQTSCQALNGSNETATVYMRKNATSDTTLSSSVQFNAQRSPYDVTGLNVAVASGDFFTFKVVFPTFATNPSGVLMRVDMEITY